MPFAGTRRFDVHTKRTFMNQPRPAREQRRARRQEIGQVGTQLDGFRPPVDRVQPLQLLQDRRDLLRTGFTKLGIEKVGTLMTRGVLIDVAALKGVDTLAMPTRSLLKICSRPCSARICSCSPATRSSSTRAGTSSGPRTTRATTSRARASAWPRPSGWPSRTRCSSAPTTGRWRCRRTRPADLATRASDHAGRERHPHPREPEAGRALGEEGLRIRFVMQPLKAQGFPLDGRSVAIR